MVLPEEIEEFIRNMGSGREGPFDAIKWFFPPELETRRADITEYRDVIDARFGPLVYISELPKNSASAKEMRQAGNQRFQLKCWHSALLNYNEGLCFAEPGSEELGLCYANRSAVYFEQGDYELALYNIDLAKRNHYPERLMAKLLDREAQCKRKIENGQSKGIVPALRMGINVEVNPKIPFLANGIGMKQYPGLGRGLFAKKDFNPGDVILDEKPELCAVNFDNSLSYHYCFHCGSEFQTSLIPCPKCVNYMYCSERCLEQDWKQAHRFECPVAMKLFNIAMAGVAYGKLIGRLFFYGLTAFGDNVQQMMTWCEQNYDTGSDPLQIDFTEPDPLKIFKALHSTKVKPNPQFEHDLKIVAACYYQIYLKSPQVQSIFRKRVHRNFMLRCLHHYAHVTWALQSDTPRPPGVSTLAPITSLLNHSCDPNALTVIHSGRITTVLLRPLREGAQLFTSYGRLWWDPKRADYELSSFSCQCVVCGNHPPGRKWHAALQRTDIPKQLLLEVSQVAKLVEERPDVPETAKLEAMKQFIKRHARVYPLPPLGEIIRLYAVLLEDAIQAENETLERVTVRADLLGD